MRARQDWRAGEKHGDQDFTPAFAELDICQQTARGIADFGRCPDRWHLRQCHGG